MRSRDHCPTCRGKSEPRFLIYINRVHNAPTFYTIPCVLGAEGVTSAVDTTIWTPFLKAFGDFEMAYNFIAETSGRAEETAKIEVKSGDLPPRLFTVVLRHSDENPVFDCRAPEAGDARLNPLRPQFASAA